MAIPIKDASELGRLLAAVSIELVNANISFRMCMDISAAHREFYDEIQQSRTFWHQTMRANLDASVLALGKVYDQKKRNAGLPGLLDTIQANPHFFAAEEFAKRIVDRQGADTLTAEHRSLNRQILRDDIEKVDVKNNPLVGILMGMRHNFYSHRNSSDLINNRSARDKYPLNNEDVGKLILDGLNIANRYGVLFNAVSYTGQIVGHDDFKFLLERVREWLATQRNEVERALGGLGAGPDA